MVFVNLWRHCFLLRLKLYHEIRDHLPAYAQVCILWLLRIITFHYHYTAVTWALLWHHNWNWSEKSYFPDPPFVGRCPGRMLVLYMHYPIKCHLYRSIGTPTLRFWRLAYGAVVDWNSTLLPIMMNTCQRWSAGRKLMASWLQSLWKSRGACLRSYPSTRLESYTSKLIL